MKKLKFTFITLLCFMAFSCNQETVNSNKEEQLSTDLLDGFSIKLNLDLTTTYDLTKVSLEEVISITVKELNRIDLTDIDVAEVVLMRSDGTDEENGMPYVAVDFLVSDTDVQVIPTTGVGSSDETSDDVKSGGNDGDGWKSYGTCMTESCAATKSAEAVSELSSSLTSGKCLDIRVKRNALNVRVCARVISC